MSQVRLIGCRRTRPCNDIQANFAERLPMLQGGTKVYYK